MMRADECRIRKPARSKSARQVGKADVEECSRHVLSFIIHLARVAETMLP